jgi:hypothetical protein
MQLRYPIQIQCMVKALTDVVLPAVDPNNRLAQEQARLIIGTLLLMEKQLPKQYRFDCDALSRLVSFARELQQQPGGLTRTQAAVKELAAHVSVASRVLERAQADPEELVSSIHSLRAAIGAVVNAVSEEASGSQVAGMQKSVLAHSKDQLLRDRSWLLMQGWEPDPASVPPIEALIGHACTGARIARQP